MSNTVDTKVCNGNNENSLEKIVKDLSDSDDDEIQLLEAGEIKIKEYIKRRDEKKRKRFEINEKIYEERLNELNERIEKRFNELNERTEDIAAVVKNLIDEKYEKKMRGWEKCR